MTVGFLLGAEEFILGDTIWQNTSDYIYVNNSYPSVVNVSVLYVNNSLVCTPLNGYCNSTSSVVSLPLNNVSNPTDNTTFQMDSKTLSFIYTSPQVSDNGAFTIEALGGFRVVS